MFFWREHFDSSTAILQGVAVVFGPASTIRIVDCSIFFPSLSAWNLLYPRSVAVRRHHL